MKYASRLLLAALMLGQSSFVAAEGPEDYTAVGIDTPHSVIGEATKAVVGRVFGIGGDAPDINYHAVELTAHSPNNAALRSLIIPGWGQAFNRQRVKGAVLFVTAVGSAYWSVRLYQDSNESYDSYERRGLKDGDEYDEYKSERTRSYLLGTVALGLWAFGVYDAYKNAYNPLWSKDNRIDVAYDSDYSGVRWSRKFQ